MRALLRETPVARERTVVPNLSNAISAEKVSYGLAGRQKPILQDVSFEIPARGAVGIVGPSGSGKSTIVRLLIGAIAPSAGVLRYGGVEYRKWDREERGRQVGYLPQDVGLFAGTVRDNIARFDEAPVDDVVAAAKAAGVHEMIMELPEQYDTRLGPGGVGLSGGQRQRLGLARALLGNPRLLVLDEPNANLDGEGEAALKKALTKLKKKGTTIVLVTHRTTVLEVVDTMMFVRDGKLEIHDRPEKVYAHIKENVVPEFENKAA